MSYSALGDTVNVASRLQASAEPGSVCITKATLDLVEGFVDATFLGMFYSRATKPNRSRFTGSMRCARA